MDSNDDGKTVPVILPAVVAQRLEELRMLIANLYIRLGELERRVNNIAPRGD